MGIYLPEIYKPCICSTCCRISICTTEFIMCRICKIFSYLLPLAEVGHWAFFLVYAFDKIFTFLHLWWLWEGTTTWNYSLPASLFSFGFFCPGQVLEILRVLGAVSQWQPPAIIVNSNVSTVLACVFPWALSVSPSSEAKEFTEHLSQQSAASRQNMQDTADLQNSQQGTQVPWKRSK